MTEEEREAALDVLTSHPEHRFTPEDIVVLTKWFHAVRDVTALAAWMWIAQQGVENLNTIHATRELHPVCGMRFLRAINGTGQAGEKEARLIDALGDGALNKKWSPAADRSGEWDKLVAEVEEALKVGS